MTLQKSQKATTRQKLPDKSFKTTQITKQRQ